MDGTHDSNSPMPQPAPVERNRIASATFLRARGRGRIEVELKGTGQLTMIRGRYDDFCFEGKGLPRHLSATCVHLRAAHGRVILEGEDLELEFFGGTCTALLVGTFQVETRGTGAPKPAARQASEMPTKTSKKLKDRRSSPRR